ncbi:MAG: DMT family transporter, partial [Syntrophorhabdales bacterium]
IKQPLFHKDIRLFHGFIVGLLFNLEFICVYVSLIYTDAARSVIFVNLSPFVVAIGAYIFVREKLGVWQVGGIVLAFLGAYLVLQGKPRTWTSAMLKGDLLAITAAVLWGATTVYIILDYGRESTNKSKKRVRWAAVQRQLQCRITMTDAMSVAVTPSTKTIFDLGVQRFSPTQIFRFITLSLPVGIAFYTPFMLDSQTAFFTSMFGL